jgi:molecular chaperone GrpE (heat shock protein)
VINPYKLAEELQSMSDVMLTSETCEVNSRWLKDCAEAAQLLQLEVSRKQGEGDRGNQRELRAKAKAFDLQEEVNRLRSELEESVTLTKCKAYIFDLQNEVGKLKHEIERLSKRNEREVESISGGGD